MVIGADYNHKNDSSPQRKVCTVKRFFRNSALKDGQRRRAHKRAREIVEGVQENLRMCQRDFIQGLTQKFKKCKSGPVR